MKKAKAFTVSPILTIIALLAIIGLGAYLALVIINSQKTEDTTTTSNQPVASNTANNTVSFDQTTETTNTTSQTTTADATADWQTYTNTEYGFSFKYPKDWAVKSSKDEAEVRGTTAAHTTYKATITTENKDTFTFSSPIPEIGYEAWQFANKKTITSGTGIVFTRQYGPSTTASGLNNEMYWAKTAEMTGQKSSNFAGTSSKLTDDLIDNLDQILSTFKFTP